MLYEKALKTTDVIVSQTEQAQAVADEIAKCLPIVHKKKKEELQRKHSACLERLERSYETLTACGVSRIHNNHTFETFTVEKATKMAELAQKYKLPKLKAKIDHDTETVERMKLARAAKSKAVKSARDSFIAECRKVLPEQCEAAYLALKAADYPSVSSFVKTNMLSILKEHGIQSKPSAKEATSERIAETPHVSHSRGRSR